MYIQLSNNERVFQVVTSTGKQFFCNVGHLNEICKDMNQGYFKIFSFDDLKAKKVSNKDLKKFFEGQQLEQLFYY